MALLFASVNIVLAQRTVTGTVADDQGEPLIGATLTVVGTTVGAVTDVNGAFRFNVPAGATTLKCVYTGYVALEIPLTSENNYNIVMAQDLAQLEEIVVVGYGSQQKRSITGTIASVKGEDIAALPGQSFDQLLQGRAAGVNVSLPNGVLNNPPVFRVRGINSINLSSFPLVVIDGVPTYTGEGFSQNSAANNPLSNLNTNDIESIEILKDASATAIYGSRASAGVVIITTKRGKAGKTKVSYDAWAGWQQVVRTPELLNAEQYVALKNEAAANANLAPQFFLDTINGQQVNTNWFDYVYRTGFSHNHGLSFSGGSDATTYYLSLGYTNQQGMIVANDFSRLSSRLNLDHKLSKRIKLGATMGYANNFNAAPNTGSLTGQAFSTAGLGRVPLITAPTVAPYLADGVSYNVSSTNRIGKGKNLQEVGFYNPVPIIDLNSFTSEAAQLQASAYAQLTIADGLALKTQYGIDNINVENITFQTPIHGDGFGTNGFAANTNIRNNRWNWQNLLTYDKTLAEKHTVGALVGHEEQHTISEGWGASRQAIADPFFTTYQGNYTTINPAGNFQGENYLLSFFGRLNYDYDKKFFATFNLRQDEYSAFALGQKKGTFWGASAGVAISEFDFWRKSLGDVVNYFKLRGSYGTVGNNNGIGDFASLSLYGSGLYAAVPTISYGQAGNAALSWETSTKTDAGIVFGLFNDRLQGEYSYFINDIDGLILNAPQAPSKGIPGNSIAINIGAMRNTGHEFSLSSTILRSGKFSWTTNVNLTLMKNEVTELYEGADIFGATSGLETANIIRVGESVGSLYVLETDGVNSDNGRRIFVKADGTRVQYSHVVGAGDFRWSNLDGTSATQPTLAVDGQVYGPTLPTWFGGWDNTFRYGGWDLNIQMNYAGGNYIYNGSKAGMRDMRFWNNHTDVLDHWTEDNKSGTIPRVVFGDNVSNGSATPISENVEKGDFLRIRNITLGYKLPNSLIDRAKISSLRVYANVNNAFLFTNYSGTDPEVSTNGNSNIAPGVDRNVVPMPRGFTIGLNLGL